MMAMEKEPPPLLHPLGGSNLSTFISAWQDNRPFDRRSMRTRLFSIFAVLARLPFYQIERLLHDRAIAEIEIKEDPIFIVGHWRSGTTHLHNLLSQDEQFGSISFLQTAMPWEFLGKLKIAPPIIERALPETRGMDNVKLTLDSPQEEEMALGNMQPLCYYYCYYFPRKMREHYNRSILFENVSEAEKKNFAEAYRYLCRKLTYCHKGKRLLLKNPASTGRISWLKSIFPRAKFIHMVRNPFVVFCSTMRHYQHTLPAFAWQSYDSLDRESITIENYSLLMRRYLDHLPSLPAEDICEVTYESVDRDPVGEIGRIYDYFGFQAKEAALAAVQRYARQQQDYRKNIYSLTADQVERIRQEWAFALRHWDYDLPPEITISG